MDFRELCQKTTMRCSIGDADGSVPATVVGQTGELARIVEFVMDSWNDIQIKMNYWLWMRSKFTVNTVADQQAYAPTDFTDTVHGGTITMDRFREWLIRDYRNPPKIYLTSTGITGQRWLTWISWDTFQTLYNINYRAPGNPVHIAVDPQMNIVLGPTPNSTFTLTGEYQRGNQTLDDNDDVPEMPSQYHMLIVYGAMDKYADYESSPEVARAAAKGRSKLMPGLLRTQLPKVRRGAPLVQ